MNFLVNSIRNIVDLWDIDEYNKMMNKFRSYTLSLIVLLTGYQSFSQDLSHVKIANVNSSYDEQNPVLSPDGTKLYFTRASHPENSGGVVDKGDIWWSEKNADGTWGEAVHGGPKLNHNGLNGVVGFSSSGNTVYLLNYFDRDRSTGRGTLRAGLAKSTWNGTEWGEPERIRIMFFSNRSEYISGYITPDETTMILSIQSYQTYGNEDLYVTFRQADGAWSQPKNIGKTINTPSQEWSPYLGADKKTLYFSSNGHEGSGSRDVFVSQRLDDSWMNWSKPVNLGDRINTKGVETGYYIPNQGDMAYFSTTQNSEGFGDIFNIPLAEAEKALQEIELVSDVVEETPEEVGPPVVAVTMQVLDVRNDKPLKDAVAIFSYGVDQNVVDLSDISGEDKKFIASFVEDTKVKVRIEAEGYLVYEEEFTAKATPGTGGDLETVEAFRMTPSDVGTTIQIKNILFKRATAQFSDIQAAKVELDKLIRLMKNNPRMEIRLEGHTDNRGDSRLNRKLSEDRVITVKAYLVDNGIAEKRIATIGHGGSKPIASNSMASSRVLNRRVEFVVIKN